MAIQFLLFLDCRVGLQQQIGKVQSVLFEKIGRENGQMIDRTPHGYSLHAVADVSVIGTLQQVEMTDHKRNSLGGKII